MPSFDKQSNELPTPQPGLPPELKPFYSQQPTNSGRAGRIIATLCVLAILVAAVLVGIGIHLALTGKTTSKNHAQVSTSVPATQSTQPKSTTPAQTSPVTPAPSSTSQPTTPATTMPDTGPGTEPVLIAVTAGLLGASLYHLQQVRRSRV
jgi:hypothetical protein